MTRLRDGVGQVKNVRRMLAFVLVWLTFVSTVPALAQDQDDEEPDPANGAAIYAARCANCHGPLGLGDGELAANLPNRPPAIGSAEYLATADVLSMAQTIYNGRIEQGMPGFGEGNNSTPLTEQEIFDVVAGLSLLDQMNRPIANAQVVGQAVNGSTGELLAEGTVTLQAFTAELEEGGIFTTDILPDGSFIFELSSMPPNWFYRTSVHFDGLDFTSRISRLTPLETEATLNVAVFEQTADDAGIRVWQHQSLVDFAPDAVQVAEIYLFSNTERSVYVGDGEGTVQVPIPADAKDVIFLQGFGSAESFTPIEEPLVEGEIWRPNLPILPGDGTLQLLIRYTLPFEPGMTIRHPVPYPVDFIELILPDTGVLLAAEPDSGWRPEELTTGSDGDAETRLRYSRPPMPPDSDLTFTLSGFPSIVLDANGNRVVQRDDVSEMLIGMVVLIIVAAAVAITGYSWHQQPPPESGQQELVRRIAALDLAHSEKTISKRAWKQRRTDLMNQLKSIWQ